MAYDTLTLNGDARPTAGPEDVLRVAAGHGPITLTLGKVKKFRGDDHDVLYVEADGEELRQLRAKLRLTLPNTQTHRVYRPHITLATVAPGACEEMVGNASMAGQTVTVHELVFADHQGRRFVVPLGAVNGLATKAWDESKHPRGQPGNAGEFGPGGTVRDLVAKVRERGLELGTASKASRSAESDTKGRPALSVKAWGSDDEKKHPRDHGKFSAKPGAAATTGAAAKRKSKRLPPLPPLPVPGFTEEVIHALGKVAEPAIAVAKKLGHYEHLAAEFVTPGERVSKLPDGLPAAVKGAWWAVRTGTKSLFAGYVAGQAAAAFVARKSGLSKDHAKILGATLANWDMGALAANKALVVAHLCHIPIPHIAVNAAEALLWVPVASLGYLAYKASGPLIAAAKVLAKLPMALRRKGLHEGAGHHDLIQLLADRIKEHDGSDWYLALLAVAGDKTNDLGQAISIADEAIEATPTGTVVPGTKGLRSKAFTSRMGEGPSDFTAATGEGPGPDEEAPVKPTPAEPVKPPASAKPTSTRPAATARPADPVEPESVKPAPVAEEEPKPVRPGRAQKFPPGPPAPVSDLAPRPDALDEGEHEDNDRAMSLVYPLPPERQETKDALQRAKEDEKKPPVPADVRKKIEDEEAHLSRSLEHMAVQHSKDKEQSQPYLDAAKKAKAAFDEVDAKYKDKEEEWSDLGEGPFASREDAEDFRIAEVGVPSRSRLSDGGWAVEVLPADSRDEEWKRANYKQELAERDASSWRKMIEDNKEQEANYHAAHAEAKAKLDALPPDPEKRKALREEMEQAEQEHRKAELKAYKSRGASDKAAPLFAVEDSAREVYEKAHNEMLAAKDEAEEARRGLGRRLHLGDLPEERAYHAAQDKADKTRRQYEKARSEAAPWHDRVADAAGVAPAKEAADSARAAYEAYPPDVQTARERHEKHFEDVLPVARRLSSPGVLESLLRDPGEWSHEITTIYPHATKEEIEQFGNLMRSVVVETKGGLRQAGRHTVNEISDIAEALTSVFGDTDPEEVALAKRKKLTNKLRGERGYGDTYHFGGLKDHATKEWPDEKDAKKKRVPASTKLDADKPGDESAAPLTAKPAKPAGAAQPAAKPPSVKPVPTEPPEDDEPTADDEVDAHEDEGSAASVPDAPAAQPKNASPKSSPAKEIPAPEWWEEKPRHWHSDFWEIDKEDPVSSMHAVFHQLKDQPDKVTPHVVGQIAARLALLSPEDSAEFMQGAGVKSGTAGQIANYMARQALSLQEDHKSQDEARDPDLKVPPEYADSATPAESRQEKWKREAQEKREELERRANRQPSEQEEADTAGLEHLEFLKQRGFSDEDLVKTDHGAEPAPEKIDEFKQLSAEDQRRHAIFYLGKVFRRQSASDNDLTPQGIANTLWERNGIPRSMTRGLLGELDREDRLETSAPDSFNLSLLPPKPKRELTSRASNWELAPGEWKNAFTINPDASSLGRASSMPADVPRPMDHPEAFPLPPVPDGAPPHAVQDRSPHLPKEASPDLSRDQANAVSAYMGEATGPGDFSPAIGDILDDLATNNLKHEDVPDHYWDDPDFREAFKALPHLQQAFAQAKPFAQPVAVRHWMGLKQDALESFADRVEKSHHGGDPLVMDGFLRTTQDEGITGPGTHNPRMAEGGKNVLLNIQAKHGLDMMPYADPRQGGPADLLLNAGSKFRVTRFVKYGEQMIVDLEHSPDGKQPPPQPSPQAHEVGLGPLPSTREHLQSADITSTKSLNSGANQSSKVTLKDGRKAVFKPESGEANGLDQGVETGTFHIREAAASHIAEILGLGDLVPATTIRTIDGERGSIQQFVPDAKVAGFFDSDRYKYGKSDQDLGKAAAFDYLLANSDRHEGNWMVTKSGRLVLIDNGLSMPTNYDEKNVATELIWRAHSKKIYLPDMRAWESKRGQVERTLKDIGIEDDAIALAMKRFDTLVDASKASSGRLRIGQLPSWYKSGTLGDYFDKIDKELRE